MRLSDTARRLGLEAALGLFHLERWSSLLVSVTCAETWISLRCCRGFSFPPGHGGGFTPDPEAIAGSVWFQMHMATAPPPAYRENTYQLKEVGQPWFVHPHNQKCYYNYSNHKSSPALQETIHAMKASNRDPSNRTRLIFSNNNDLLAAKYPSFCAVVLNLIVRNWRQKRKKRSGSWALYWSEVMLMI